MLTILASSCLFSVDGNWTDWTSWSDCSETCGDGSHYRIRHCANPTPMYGGKNCSGEPLHGESCKLRECPSESVELLGSTFATFYITRNVWNIDERKLSFIYMLVILFTPHVFFVCYNSSAL